jgi:hypothetical protein
VSRAIAALKDAGMIEGPRGKRPRVIAKAPRQLLTLAPSANTVDDAESDLRQGAAESTRAQQLQRPRVESRPLSGGRRSVDAMHDQDSTHAGRSCRPNIGRPVVRAPASRQGHAVVHWSETYLRSFIVHVAFPGAEGGG